MTAKKQRVPEWAEEFVDGTCPCGQSRLVSVESWGGTSTACVNTGWGTTRCPLARLRKSIERRRAWAKRNWGPKSLPLCPNGCGERGPHFVPPSMGDPGFFTCTPKEREHG